MNSSDYIAGLPRPRPDRAYTEREHKDLCIERHNGKEYLAREHEWTIPFFEGDDADDIRKWNQKQLHDNHIELHRYYSSDDIISSDSNELYPVVCYITHLGLIDKYFYLVFPCVYTGFEQSRVFTDNKPISVLRYTIPGQLERNGTFTPLYEKAIPSINPFHEYFAARLNFLDASYFEYNTTVIKDGQFAIFYDFDCVIPFGRFKSITGFDRGLAIATNNAGKQCLINLEGKSNWIQNEYFEDDSGNKIYFRSSAFDYIEPFYGMGEKTSIELVLNGVSYRCSLFSLVDKAYYETLHWKEVSNEKYGTYEDYLEEQEWSLYG